MEDIYFPRRSASPLDVLKKLNKFLNTLEDNKIFYRLSKIRRESIMVEVAVPGQRWEIEFMDNGTIEIEKFFSEGTIHGSEELQVLVDNFSD